MRWKFKFKKVHWELLIFYHIHHEKKVETNGLSWGSWKLISYGSFKVFQLILFHGKMMKNYLQTMMIILNKMITMMMMLIIKKGKAKMMMMMMITMNYLSKISWELNFKELEVTLILFTHNFCQLLCKLSFTFIIMIKTNCN